MNTRELAIALCSVQRRNKGRMLPTFVSGAKLKSAFLLYVDLRARGVKCTEVEVTSGLDALLGMGLAKRAVGGWGITDWAALEAFAGMREKETAIYARSSVKRGAK